MSEKVYFYWPQKIVFHSTTIALLQNDNVDVTNPLKVRARKYAEWEHKIEKFNKYWHWELMKPWPPLKTFNFSLISQVVQRQWHGVLFLLMDHLERAGLSKTAVVEVHLLQIFFGQMSQWYYYYFVYVLFVLCSCIVYRWYTHGNQRAWLLPQKTQTRMIWIFDTVLRELSINVYFYSPFQMIENRPLSMRAASNWPWASCRRSRRIKTSKQSMLRDKTFCTSSCISCRQRQHHYTWR